MAGKPTEIKRLAAILEGDYESATDCAKDLFKAVEEMLWTREHYIVIIQRFDNSTKQTALLQSFGPYPTYDKARKEGEKKVFGIGGDITTQWRVALLKHPDTV